MKTFFRIVSISLQITGLFPFVFCKYLYLLLSRKRTKNFNTTLDSSIGIKATLNQVSWKADHPIIFWHNLSHRIYFRSGNLIIPNQKLNNGFKCFVLGTKGFKVRRLEAKLLTLKTKDLNQKFKDLSYPKLISSNYQYHLPEFISISPQFKTNPKLKVNSEEDNQKIFTLKSKYKHLFINET